MKSRSNANSTVATAASPTVRTGRSTRTCTRRTSRTTARCAAATNPTRTRPRCGSTWRCTGRARRPTGPVTIPTIRTTTATATLPRRVPLRRRRPRRPPDRLNTSTTSATTSITRAWARCPSATRLICPSGTFAKVRPACPLRRPPSTRPSDQWPTYTTQHHRQWLIDAQSELSTVKSLFPFFLFF